MVLISETYHSGSRGQTLMARKGNCVIRQSLQIGPEDGGDLQENLDEFATILAAWQRKEEACEQKMDGTASRTVESCRH